MKDQSWIADLLAGYKTVQLAGTPITKRSVLNLLSGFTAVDNPATQTTDLTAAGTGFTHTTADFVQPAVNGTVSVQMGDTSSLVVGFGALVQNGGIYEVASITNPTHAVLTNLGDPHNASPGSTISSGALVIASASGQNPPGIGPIVNQVDGVSIALGATEGQAAVMGGGLPVAQGVRIVLNVKSFGAVGDGVHDDGPAIQAAEHARSLTGSGPIKGAVVYFPSGLYLTNQELHMESHGAIWEGDSAYGASTIRAGASIRSVLFTGFGFHHIRDLNFDGNLQAKFGILRRNDPNSHYNNVEVINTKLSGFMSHGFFDPGQSISGPITQSGPASPAITGFVDNLIGGLVNPNPLYVKITVTGANDGSAQFETSTNGSIYGPAAGVYPTVFALTPATSSAFFATDTGIRLNFPPGTYNAGTVYQVPMSYPALALNDATCFSNCLTSICGYLVQTTGQSVATGFTTIQVADTITTTAGGQVVTFSGPTDLTTLSIRPGDYLLAVGGGPAGEDVWVQINGVMDPTHLAIGVTSTGLIGAHAGIKFRLAIGAGFFNSPEFDAGVQTFLNCNFASTCANGMVLMGTIGNCGIDINLEGFAGVGLAIGSDSQVNAIDNVFVRTYFEAGTPFGVPFDDKSGGGTVLIAPTNLFFQLDRLTSQVFTGSALYGQTQTRAWAEFFLDSVVSLTGDGQIIATPQRSISNQHSSFIRLGAAGSYTLGNLAPSNDITHVRLMNFSSFPLKIPGVAHGSTYWLQADRLVLQPLAYIDFFQLNNNWYQMGPMKSGWTNANTGVVNDEGSNTLVTTNATPTNIWDINTQNDPAYGGFSADIVGYTAGGAAMATYEDVRGRFANGVLLGAMTVGNQTGTDPGGVPPAAWGGPAIVLVSGQYQLQVTGAAATSITWRVKLRQF